MRRTILALALSAFAASAAFATDLGPRTSARQFAAPVSYSWDGWYLGLNVGAGIVDNGSSITQTGSLASLIPQNAGAHPRGWMYGGHAGFNKQFGVVVLGLEGTFDFTNIKADNASSSAVNRNVFNTLLATTASSSSDSTKLNWLSTIVGRAGVTILPRALLYGKAGVAFGQVETMSASNVVSTAIVPGVCTGSPSLVLCPNSSGASSTKSTKTGWTVGAGLEAALGANWTARGEVSYFDLGTVGGAYANAGTPATITYASALHGWNALMGISYKFQ